LIWSALGIFLLLGLMAALYIGIQVDLSWMDRPWIYSLSRLGK
jgi:hypothetical protein